MSETVERGCTPPTIKTAVIGWGRMGRIHGSAWQSVGELRAVCDPHFKGEIPGVRLYADAERMLAAERLDIVSVCCPPSSHAAAVEACLNYDGVTVLCEKPLAVDLDGGRTLAHPRVQMAAKFRHIAAVTTARDYLHSGVIGRPVSFRIEFLGVVQQEGTWYADPRQAGGGVVIDNGSHAFDLIAFLFSPVRRVMSLASTVNPELDVEDTALLMTETEDGLLGSVHLSWSLPAGRNVFLTVQGTRGVIEVGWNGGTVYQPGGAPQAFGGGYDKAATYRDMMTSAAAWAQGQGGPFITPQEGWHSVAAVEAAYRSLQSGHAVMVPALPALAAGWRIA